MEVDTKSLTTVDTSAPVKELLAKQIIPPWFEKK